MSSISGDKFCYMRKLFIRLCQVIFIYTFNLGAKIVNWQLTWETWNVWDLHPLNASGFRDQRLISHRTESWYVEFIDTSRIFRQSSDLPYCINPNSRVHSLIKTVRFNMVISIENFKLRLVFLRPVRVIIIFKLTRKQRLSMILVWFSRKKSVDDEIERLIEGRIGEIWLNYRYWRRENKNRRQNINQLIGKKKLDTQISYQESRLWDSLNRVKKFHTLLFRISERRDRFFCWFSCFCHFCRITSFPFSGQRREK